MKINYNQILILVLVCIFISCDKDDYIIEPENSEEVSNNENEDFQKSVLTINNQVYPVGFGVNPNGFNDNEHSYIQPGFASPLVIEDKHKIIDNSPFGSFAKTEVLLIRNEYDLKRLTSKVTSRSVSVFGITFARSRKKLDELFKFDGKTIYFLAKAELNTHRVTLSGRPELTPRAKNMLDKGEYANFRRKYGPGYVSSQTFGGNLFYVFSFKRSGTYNVTNSSYTRPLKHKIEKMFGIESDIVLAEWDREIIRNTQLEYSVATNIKNFIPKPIKNTDEFRSEVRRATDFLFKNRNFSASTNIIVRPYNNIIRGFDEAFANVLEEEIRKFDNWKNWDEVRFSAESIIKESPYVEFRQGARKIRNIANQQIYLTETNYSRAKTVKEALDQSPDNFVNIYQFNNPYFSHILTPDKFDPQLDIFGPTRYDYAGNLKYTRDSSYPKFKVKLISTDPSNDLAIYKFPWGCGVRGKGGPRYYTRKVTELKDTQSGNISIDYGTSFLGFSSKYYSRSEPEKFVKVSLVDYTSGPCKYKYRTKYDEVGTSSTNYNVWFIAQKRF